MHVYTVMRGKGLLAHVPGLHGNTTIPHIFLGVSMEIRHMLKQCAPGPLLSIQSLGARLLYTQ